MITSLGLALAVWVRSLGRAVGLTVTLYCLLAVGWLFLCVALTNPSTGGEYWAMGSPFFCAGALTAEIGESSNRMRDQSFVGWGLVWTVVFAFMAIALLNTTLATFDGCLGRMCERTDWRNMGLMYDRKLEALWKRAGNAND